MRQDMRLEDPTDKTRPTSQPIAVDLFCGAGGLSYGMKHAGITISAGIDIDPACKHPFEANVLTSMRRTSLNCRRSSWSRCFQRTLSGFLLAALLVSRFRLTPIGVSNATLSGSCFPSLEKWSPRYSRRSSPWRMSHACGNMPFSMSSKLLCATLATSTIIL